MKDRDGPRVEAPADDGRIPDRDEEREGLAALEMTSGAGPPAGELAPSNEGEPLQEFSPKYVDK